MGPMELVSPPSSLSANTRSLMAFSCSLGNVLILIGHINLKHVGEVGPDFFVSNCHK